MRLYPPIAVNSRIAERDTTLPCGGGSSGDKQVYVSKGTVLAYSLYAMHRRADLFGMDAEVFRPERWNEEMPFMKDTTTLNWAYLPFHGGSRSCLGMDFALTEASYAITVILRERPNLTWMGERTITGNEKQAVSLVLSLAGGCKVQL